MHKIISPFILSLCLFNGAVLSGQPQYEWVGKMGGKTVEYMNSFDNDASGNVYTIGQFRSVGDYDPGAAVYNLTNVDYADAYFSKLDSKGRFVWAKRLGNLNAGINPICIKADKKGNLFILGEFNNIGDFDPGTGVYNMGSSGQSVYATFLLKLDTAGKFIWAKSFIGSANTNANGMCLDTAGNIIITGTLEGTTDFDPGAGKYLLKGFNNPNLYVAKLDASGSFLWAGMAGGIAPKRCTPYSMKVDKPGNIYITGLFSDTVDFDLGTGVNQLVAEGMNDNIFILKLNKSGKTIWAKRMGSNTGYQFPGQLAIGYDNRVGFGGSFIDTLDVDPGIGKALLISNGKQDGFVAWLDSNGQYSSSFSYGAAGDDFSSISTDTFNNIYITGRFVYTVDFDPDPSAQYKLTSIGKSDLFLVKLNPSGTFLWARQLSGTGFVYAPRINFVGNDAMYMAGSFYGTQDFNPDPSATNNLSNSTDSGDVFVLKLSQCKASNAVISAKACNKYVYNGKTYTNSGVYFKTLTSYIGCDSIVRLNLTIVKSSAAILNVKACKEYKSPSGKYKWTQDGTYFDTIPGVFGCDSFMTIKLDIQSSSSTVYLNACSSLKSPSGKYTWNNSGKYGDTIKNTYGCDSFMSIFLSLGSTSTTVSINACSSLKSPSGKYIWTTSGTYIDTITNTSGCDSILTIHLKIRSSSSSVSIVSCNGITSPSGKYVWWLSGVYRDTIVNAFGCDSFITVNLTIKSSASVISIKSCGSVVSPSGKHIYTTTGIYADTIPNKAGCDSFIAVKVSIHKNDKGISLSDTTLTASSNRGTYRWLNCSNGMAVVPGETSKTFVPDSSGSYAVEVTDSGCVDTSACVNVNLLGLNTVKSIVQISVHPNPSNGDFDIHLPYENARVLVKLRDMSGKIISNQVFENMAVCRMRNLPVQSSGIYLLEVSFGAYRVTKKINLVY